MPNAAQSTGNFKGDNLSVKMFAVNSDASGDGQRVNDATIANGAAIVNSASGLFLPTDVGKVAIFVGAGAAGAILQSTVKTFNSATQIVLAANASTAVASAGEFTWGTDNTAAFNNGLTAAGSLTLPVGMYLLAGNVSAVDLVGIRMFGQGKNTIIVPCPSLTGNIFDFSGSSDVDIEQFQVDGRYYPDQLSEVIAGDGTASNPSYGPLHVNKLLIQNVKTICLGLGATTGRTCHDVTYENIDFVNCGAGTHLPNTIDTGSNGTKLRYKFNNLRFIYVTPPPSLTTAGVAMFMGHGTNQDFQGNNISILNCPIDGIQVYNRSFTTETTSLSDFTFSNVTVINPGWTGVSIYGGSNIRFPGLTIINAGQALDSVNERRTAVLISTQHSGAGPTISGAVNVTITDHTLVDNQGSPTAKYGIYESNDGTPVTNDATGQIADCQILGQTTTDIQVNTKFAIQRYNPTSLKWAFGKAGLVDSVNLIDNLQIQSSLDSLFNENTVTAATAGGNFMLCRTFNAHFDGTNWVSGNDTANNGFIVIGAQYGSANTFRIYVVPRTGTTNQTLTPTQLETHLALALPAVNKGDILAGGTTGVGLTTLPVGSNGSVLTADSTQTLGVKWAATGASGVTSLDPGSLTGAVVLSAGTGIGLSNPGGNAIQITNSQPFFQGSWTSYSPTITVAGGSTVAVLSAIDCDYLQVGKVVFLRVFGVVTVGTAPSSFVAFSFPVTSASNNQTLAASVFTGGNYFSVAATLSGFTVQFFQTGGTAWPTGTAFTFWGEGVYQST